MATKIEKTDTGLIIPYESLMGIRVKEPILSSELSESIRICIANYTGAKRWEKWGMSEIKDGGSVILLIGPSGTGKTTIARWLAKQLGSGFIPLSMGDIGGAAPGDTERNLSKLFKVASKDGNTTIFMDECDGILVARESLGPDSMWMVTVINALLQKIENYKGPIIMATNRDHVLDPALDRRISDRIYILAPDFETRKRLWQEKIPAEFPITIDDNGFEELAIHKLTGAEIENCIITEAKTAIRQGRNPKYNSLCNIAKTYATHERSKTS
jgi:SpoVK/Ycf46/Vps4 family AAA+-type ATPase